MPDGRLHHGQSIVSSNGQYRLTMQSDGNLVMYDGNGRVRYHFAGSGAVAIMQTDGNFVEYTLFGTPVWNTQTWGNPGSSLHIQNDGNLVVYNPHGMPLWHIGAVPRPDDPQLPAEVVARDLDFPIGGFIGHNALYDGNGSVFEAQVTSGYAIRSTRLADYKAATSNFWGTASPSIPAGISARGCYRTHCYSTRDFEQFEMRVAIIRSAYATSLIGADYTYTAQWSPAYWGNQNSMPRRGVFRCDTFVLAMLAIPPYASVSPAVNRWRTFITRFAYVEDKNPKLVFDRLKAYR